VRQVDQASIRIIKFLTERLKDFEDLSDKVLKSRDKKSVHRLRVCTRQIRAVLWILKRTSVPAHVKKLGRRLEELGDFLGDSRELDVAGEDAEKFGVKIKHLKKKKKAADKTLKHQLTPSKQKKIRKKMRRLISDVKNSPPTRLNAAADELKKRLKKDGAQKRLGTADLHQLRIDFKKARYVLEALGRPVAPLKNIKKTLGRAHDFEVLEKLSAGKHRSGAKKIVRKRRVKIENKANQSKKGAIRFAERQLSRVKTDLL
jgi:CHAD domain-containing protein